MVYQEITAAEFARAQVELFSTTRDHLAAIGRQALTGACLGAVGLTVFLSVTAVLLGAVQLGIGGSGPVVPPELILLH